MNVTLNLNWETGQLVKLQFGNMIEVAAEKVIRGFRSQQVQLFVKLMQLLHETNNYCESRTGKQNANACFLLDTVRYSCV